MEGCNTVSLEPCILQRERRRTFMDDFRERESQQSRGSVRIAPFAQHSWKGSAHTAKAVLSHFLTNAPFCDRILHLWGFTFRDEFCFDLHFVLFKEEAHHVEKHLPLWASSSKQEAGWSTRLQHSLGNQLLGTSAAPFSVTGVSAFGQESLRPKTACCQIQQSCGFYLQHHYLPFLCVCTVN